MSTTIAIPKQRRGGIGAWFKRVFGVVSVELRQAFTTAAAYLRTNKAVAVRVVAGLNQAVETGAADLIVAFIPGEVDDYALDTLRRVLPWVAVRIAIFDRVVAGTDEEIMAALIQHLRDMPLPRRAEAYKRLAAHIYIALEDGQLSNDEAVSATQAVYRFLREQGFIK
jgi:hypothetical protein